jgi:predicted DNA-binding transcriptional regulator AlpA
MEAIYVPNETDIRKWIQEAVAECLKKDKTEPAENQSPVQEPLLSREQVLEMFGITAPTLNAWMAGGLTYYRQPKRRLLYFLKSEILEYMRVKKKNDTF